MKGVVHAGVGGGELDDVLPKRYAGLADAGLLRQTRLTVISIPHDCVVTSADVERTLSAVRGHDPIAAFAGDMTVEAAARITALGGRALCDYPSAAVAVIWQDCGYGRLRSRRVHPDLRRDSGHLRLYKTDGVERGHGPP